MNTRHTLGPVEDARRIKEKDLRKSGYEILSEERIYELLGTTSTRPDIVASRGEEVLVVEFAQRRSNSSLPDEVKTSLSELSRIVETNPNWHLELVWIGEDTAVPDEQVVDSYADRAVFVAKHDEAAGLLLAFAALEGAIARLVERTAELRESSPRPRRIGASQLASLGLISPEDFNELNAARRARNAVAHGMDVPIKPGMVEDVASLARRLADSRYVSVDQMVDWFFENYEDPANGVPFDSREGGYQYVLGGPYEAEDELSSQFPNATTEAIDEAVRLIQSEGYEWIKKGEY